MEVKLEQHQKALGPMLVTVSGMMVFWQPETNLLDAVLIIALQPLRESNHGFSDETTTLVNFLQPVNGLYPILETETGITTEVKPEQFSKAPESINVTDSGIVMDINPEQPQKAK